MGSTVFGCKEIMQISFRSDWLGVWHSAWCFTTCEMSDFFFEHANKEVEGQLVRPNFANLFWVPNIVLDVLKLMKCQTSSLKMLTKKWKDSLSDPILQISFRSDWLGVWHSAWHLTTATCVAKQDWGQMLYVFAWHCICLGNPVNMHQLCIHCWWQNTQTQKGKTD